MRKTLWFLLIVAVMALGSISLTGCGKGMNGKYANDMMEVEFKGSKAYVGVGMKDFGRTTVETKYDVDGDKIVLHNQAGNLVLTRNTDGTLSGGPGGEMAGPLKKVN